MSTLAIESFETVAEVVDLKSLLLVILICISLMTNNDACRFRCLFAICILSLMEYLFKSFAHFRGVVCLTIIECKSSFYILDISLLSDICLANIFFPSPWLLFNSLNSVFRKARVFNFDEVLNAFFKIGV